MPVISPTASGRLKTASVTILMPVLGIVEQAFRRRAISPDGSYQDDQREAPRQGILAESISCQTFITRSRA
jgi:hypothetical protein